MEVTPFGIVMLSRLSQPQKALFPMEVTVLPSIVSGMGTEVTTSPGVAPVIVTLLLSSTVYFICAAAAGIAFVPIETTLSGINMLSRFEQPLKAFSPIEVTLPGIVMLVRLEQQ